MQPLWHQKTDLAIKRISGQASAYIFSGPNTVGKYTTALWLAKKLNCRGDSDQLCNACALIDAGNYPDLVLVQPDEKSIGISQIHALQQTLALNLYYPAGMRVVIIDQASLLTLEAQNSLLKLLEEPPIRTIIFLIAHHIDNLLGTIRSRCQPVYFSPPSQSQLVDYLSQHHNISLPSATKLAQLAGGLPGLSLKLSVDEQLLLQYENTDAAASQALMAGLFERMILAAKLAQATEVLPIFIEALTRKVKRQLRENEDRMKLEAAARLQAIERFWRFRNSNVSPKAALEGLMLEL